jgi:hypothetical protein
LKAWLRPLTGLEKAFKKAFEDLLKAFKRPLKVKAPRLRPLAPPPPPD